MAHLIRDYNAESGNATLFKKLLKAMLRLGKLAEARSLLEQRYLCSQEWSNLKMGKTGDKSYPYDTNFCERCERYVTLPEDEVTTQSLIRDGGCYAIIKSRRERSLDWLISQVLNGALPLPDNLCLVLREPRLIDEMYDSEYMTERLRNCEVISCGWFADLGSGRDFDIDPDDVGAREADMKRVFDDPAFIIRGYTRYMALHRITRRNEIRFLAMSLRDETVENVDERRRAAIEAEDVDSELAVFKCVGDAVVYANLFLFGEDPKNIEIERGDFPLDGS